MPKKDLSNWSKTALAWMSFGYETQIPPITTLTFYNGVANGGRMVRPRFVTKVTHGDQLVQEMPVEVIREHMAKPEAIADIQKCLSAVVKGKHATAKQVRTKQFEISGKTGTAQVWDKGGFKNKYLVSFVGYFPSDAPQYSMIVCVKSGGSVYGGSTCGPVFKRVAEMVMSQRRTEDLTTATDSVFAHTPAVSAGNMQAATRVIHNLGLKMSVPAQDQEAPLWGSFTGSGNNMAIQAEPESKNNVMPDLTGYGLRDAVFRLEGMGLRVKAKGVGHVGRQSLKAGSTFKRGDTVYIYLGDREEIQMMADSTSAEMQKEAEEADKARADSLQNTPAKTEETRKAEPAPVPKKEAPKPKQQAKPAARPAKAKETPKPKTAPQKPKDKATPPKKQTTPPKKKK